MSLAADVTLDRRADAGPPFRLQAAFETTDGVTVVCGPSGAGKTTLLATILGALRPDRGTIRLGDRTLYDSSRNVDLPIRRRRIGMVFQDSALFPHLDVLRNVAFGIRGADRVQRAEDWLERVDGSAIARRMPIALSGGERQRVALARALANEPDALLLDEPFSALDAASRRELGRRVVALQSATGIPFVHVTHDLAEALRIGTRMVLLDGGRVAQLGPPGEVVASPTSIGAARAVGTENLFRAEIVRHRPEAGCTELDLGGTLVHSLLIDEPEGSSLAVGLRAEDILLSLRAVDGTSARNVIAGRVERLERSGSAIELTVVAPVRFRVLVTAAAGRDLALETDKPVHLIFKASAVHRLE